MLELPLFLVIFGGIVAGLLIGFVWEWFREHKHRVALPAPNAVKSRGWNASWPGCAMPSVDRKDDVLALLDRSAQGGLTCRMSGSRSAGCARAADVAAVVAAGGGLCGFCVLCQIAAPSDAGTGARCWRLLAPAGLAKVALTVDADDATLDAIIDGVPLDMLQLHGHETPERVAASARALWPAGDEGDRRGR